MDQTDLWQVVPRQEFTPYNCSLISVALIVLCRVVVVVLLFYVHRKHLRSCRDSQLT